MNCQKRRVFFERVSIIPLFCFLITIFVLRVVLSNNLLIGHSIDWNIPSTSNYIAKYLNSYLYTWGEFNLGMAQPLSINLFPVSLPFYFWGLLGFSNALVSRLVLFVAVFSALFFFYLFVEYVFLHYKTYFGLEEHTKMNKVILFLSSLTYVCSPFLFSEIIFGSHIQFLTFSLLPLCLYFYLRYLNEGKFRWFLFSLASSALQSASLQNLVFTFVLLLFFSILWGKIKTFFVYSLFFFIISSYWIFPFYGQIFSFSRWALSSIPIGDLSNLERGSPDIMKTFLGYEYFYNRNNYLATMPSFFFHIWIVNRLIFFLIPIFLLLKNRRKTAALCVLLALFLLTIFFIKTGHQPFGIIFGFIYKHIALFNLFRSPQHYQVLYTFLFSFLIAIAWIRLSLIFKERLVSKNKMEIIISFAVLINIFPWLTGDIGARYLAAKNKDHVGMYQLSPGYQRFYGFLDADKADFRLFNIPITRSPLFLETPYQDENQGGNVDNSISRSTLVLGKDNERADFIGNILDEYLTHRRKEQVIPLFAGILNFKFLALKRDIVPNFNIFAADYDYRKVKNFVHGLPFLDLLFQEDYISLYRISDRYYLPHFYAPRNIIYSPNDIEALPDILGFGDYDIRSAIYLAGERAEIKKLGNLSREDGTEIVDRADEVLVNGELKDKIGEEELGTIQPILDLPYVRQRPGSLLYSLVLKQEEFEKWRVRNEPEKLFEKYLFYASKRIAELEKYGERYRDIEIERYRGEIKGAIEEIEKLRNSVASLPEIKKSETTEIWVKMLGELEGTLAGQRAKIGEIGRLGNWEIAFGELEKKVEELKIKRVFSRLVYQIDVPKEGNYEIFVRNLPAAEIGKLGVAEWISLEERYFKKGAQELALPFSGISENLVGENLQIKDYQPDSIYQISFDYLAPKGGGFFVAEGKTGEVAETDLPATGDKLGHFEMFFKSSSEAEEGAVHLSISVAEEKNLVVRRIYHPEIILRNIEPEKFRNLEIKKLPKITFVKINPTKYRVRVEGAREPYTLVFSETFDRGWKAYVSHQPSAISDQQFGNIVASYFEGEIKEGTHKNSFLDKNTFEAWGKKPLAEEKHLLVNGYANSWHIEPGDAGGEESYEIIIEFAPQRLFYIGLGVSLATLLGCLGYLGIEEIRKFGRKAAEIKKLGN